MEKRLNLRTVDDINKNMIEMNQRTNYEVNSTQIRNIQMNKLLVEQCMNKIVRFPLVLLQSLL